MFIKAGFYLFFILIGKFRAFSNPTGCSYDSSTVLYTCSARSWSLPLQFSAFTVQPQRLLLKDISGELPAVAPNGPTFSGFSAINSASFDKRYPPSLTIMCIANGNLIIFKDTFLDFSWVEELSILDCDILSLPVEVFMHIGDVNSVKIEGGSISNMVSNSFKGLNVHKMTNAISPKGEFKLKNSKINTGQLPAGVLYNINNASVIILENIGLSSVSKSIFSAVQKVEKISLSFNSITSIPNNLFGSVSSLQTIKIFGISWDCSCDNLWFLPYAADNNIEVEGDITCQSQNVSGAAFYAKECVDNYLCKGKIGFVAARRCWTLLDMGLIAVALTCFIFIVTGIILLIKTFCRERTEKNKIESVMGIRNVMADKMAGRLKTKIEKIKIYLEDKLNTGNYKTDDKCKDQIFIAEN